MRFNINNHTLRLIANEGFDVEVNDGFLRLSRDGEAVGVVHVENDTVDGDEVMRLVKTA